MADEGSTEYDLDEVRAAREARDAAASLLDKKTEAWKAAIRRAADAGAPKPELAEAAGVNRARVYKILEGGE